MLGGNKTERNHQLASEIITKTRSQEGKNGGVGAIRLFISETTIVLNAAGTSNGQAVDKLRHGLLPSRAHRQKGGFKSPFESVRSYAHIL